jgi:hypothetical protein
VSGVKPNRILVDAAGYVWRDFGEGYLSMAPSNPDNEPLPEPVTVYLPVKIAEAAADPASETPTFQCPACGVSFEVASWESSRIYCSSDCRAAGRVGQGETQP